jgi:hypothetical protein
MLLAPVLFKNIGDLNMLTPRSDDPKRRTELNRKKKDPLAFGGFNHQTRPKDWKPGKLKGTPTVEEVESED